MTTLKPGDFLFGIVDFLAYLVPGMIVYSILPDLIPLNIPKFLALPTDENISTVGWISFLILSYVLGHFVHHIGALIFNSIYKKTYFVLKSKKHSAFIKEVEARISSLEYFKSHSDVTRAAMAYIRCKQPDLTGDLDKHEANSKLFRALTLLCIIFCFHPSIKAQGNTIYLMNLLLLILFSILSFSKFANQRWKFLLLTYEFFSILVSDIKSDSNASKQKI